MAKKPVMRKPRQTRVPSPVLPCTWVYLLFEATDDAKANAEYRQWVADIDAYSKRAGIPPLFWHFFDRFEHRRRPVVGLKPWNPRPGAEELLRHLRRDDHLVTSTGMLGPGPKTIQQALEYLSRRGITVHLLDDPAEPVVVPTHDSAEHERLREAIRRAAADNRSRHLRQGAAAAKKAKRPPGVAPYGYRRKNGRVVPHRREKRWLRLIGEWIAAGWSATDVCVELQRRHARTADGKPWAKSRVERIATRLRKQAALAAAQKTENGVI